MKGAWLIALLAFSLPLFAQDLPPVTEEQLESLGEEDPEDDGLLQNLAFYQKHPLNLNTVTAEDLYPLRLLTALQIENFLRYRTRFGKLLTLYELQAVPGFDLPIIRRLLPYVRVGDPQTVTEKLAARLRGGSTAVLLRLSRVLERAKGYTALAGSHYTGDGNRLLLRGTYQYKNLLYYGFTGEKDAGEPFFRGAQKAGFDFYSVHFFARGLGTLKVLALGDYTVNLGQGLTQWQSLGYGKGADVAAIKRQAPVLLPYRSAGEFSFSRGAAATFQWGRWAVTGFLSYKKISGNLEVDSAEHFTSFNTSGYHRTLLEMADRRQVGDFSGGGNVLYSQGALTLGLNAVGHRFSLPLQKRDAPYNYFALSGRSHFLTSVDYSYTAGNIHLFGEWAADRQLHWACIQGALISLDARVDLALVYRNLQKDYQAPFGNGFSENTLPGNEEGMYAGLQLRPAAGWQVAAYADFFRFPFLKYRVNAPAGGCDYLLQVSYAPDKKSLMTVRYRSETKPLNETGTAGAVSFPGGQHRQSLRLHFSTPLSPSVSIRGRTELAWFASSSKAEEGYLSYVETVIRLLVKWNGSLRLQYFETGSYDSRIYAFESDVLYSVSVPAFFDKGFRFYLNGSYDLHKRWTVWLRVARSVYPGKSTLGTGLETIPGNHKTDLKAQLLYRF